MNIKDILVEAIDRTGKSDTAVVGWGRGMGHKGHMYLASSVITQAKDMNADPYFVVSRTVGKDDPITPEEKLEIYRKVFPEHGHIFQTASDEMPDLTRVLNNLNQQGYRNAVVVVGADQVKALSYVKNYNGVANKAGEVPFKFDSLEVISRQETNDPSKELEGPRATPMREILMNPDASDEQKFAVWRDAMPDALSDKEVLVLMQKAQQRMGEFKPAAKKAKVKEFIQRIRPMLKEANTAQKLKALKLIKEALTEFDAGEGGFGPFKLYAGDAHKYHHVGTFKSLDDAVEEVRFLIDTDHNLITNYWKIVDGTGEQVWDQDPESMYDKMRSVGKMQFKKPGSKEVDEHIVKVKGGYELKSKHGNKNLGKYPTKAGAEKRERQVQYFKHQGVTESNGQQINDYDTWNDKVSAAGGEIHSQKDRVHLVAQTWDGDIIGEFNLKTNQGYINQQGVAEGWSEKYKRSINCSHPKGFSQKAHCAGKKKHNESIEMEMVCEDCGMCQTHGNLNEIKKGQKDSNGYTKCWPGKHAEGTKKSSVTGKQVRNCVPNESIAENASDLKKKISKYEELALAANRAGDDVKCKQYQQKIQSLKQKMSLHEQYVGTGSSSNMQMSRDIATQNATVNLARQKFGPNPQNAKPQTMHYDHEYKVIPDPNKPGNYHTTVTMTPKNYQLSPNLTAKASLDPNQDFDYFHKGEQIKPDHPLFNKIKQTHLDSMKPAIEPEVDPQNIDPLQPMKESSDDIISAKERLAHLEQIFDPSYEYSDDHSVWKRHNEIRQEMNRLKKIIGQDVTEDSDNPFELEKKHPMNHGMKKFMIRQIVKHTEYGTSELSLASDEELTQLFNEVVPNAQEVTKRFVGFLSEKLAEEKESRLYKQHQKIRKEKGLPDPSHYKKMAQQKQKEIDALNAEIAADKSKDDYLEEN